ncbi:hypothetical protein RCL_jg9538.t1 [Rhizophagus clarus]|uniref:Uncharacterized protein n=1 Tax=Rhizophagus clarus TaxID=94130 RepID=A0A8H3QJX1_9GLOM|nr:hypothetical protein RCL_jg9538.t1 [Rhizophagus clarus]
MVIIQKKRADKPPHRHVILYDIKEALLSDATLRLYKPASKFTEHIFSYQKTSDIIPRIYVETALNLKSVIFRYYKEYRNLKFDIMISTLDKFRNRRTKKLKKEIKDLPPLSDDPDFYGDIRDHYKFYGIDLYDPKIARILMRAKCMRWQKKPR